MANLRHVELLNTGAIMFNAWRYENPAETPELDGADLRGVDLGGVNLRSAKLSDADLSNANLTKAHLVSADLSRATLDHADLSDADLDSVSARLATFRVASMVHTNLCSANLASASLRGANLHAAELGNTILVDADLSNARQLETCQFRAPVGIDFRTIVRSGHLPVPFLRGCGLPEKVIENLPALLTENIDQYSVVIKGADEDRAFVERLHSDLQARGMRCWQATSSRSEPARLGFTLESYFRANETKLIVVLSRHAVSYSTPWIEHDVQLWMQNERSRNRKLLFVARVDDNVPPSLDAKVQSELRARAIDFRRWKDRGAYVHALNRLVALLSS